MRTIDEWGREGLCAAGTPLAALFRDPSKVKQAKKECFNCPVKFECWQYALIYDERGLWGGTTDNERDSYAHSSPKVIEGLILEATRQGVYEHRLSVDELVQEIRRHPLLDAS
jgi:WhiB family redox-sensing transcriptional regulator